jgi:MYXO-CTERM domain-containing protein
MWFFLFSGLQAAAPVAEAGLPLMAYVGNVVVLNGSASSDEDGDPLGFEWTQYSGPPVDLKKAETYGPEFDVEKPGTYRFELVVTDGVLDSDPDMVEVVVPDTFIDTGYSKGCSHLGGFGPAALVGLLALRRRR